MGKSEESAKKRKVVASVAVFNPQGKMLWGLRNDTKKWTMPGGHLEEGEKPLKGAIRELFEEAGLKPNDIESLGNEEVDSWDGKSKILVHAFKAMCDGKAHSKNDPDEECDKWDWVDLKDGKLPEGIASKLHSPKNVTLKLLGLQDWKDLDKSEQIIDTLNKFEGILEQLTKGQKTVSGSDATVMDLHRAPKHEMDLNFYRVTPEVANNYAQAGREGVVKGAQYVSVPSPSGGSPTVAFDNPEDLHSYIKNKYEPFITKNVLPSNGSTVLLAPIPIRSLSHDNGHRYLNLEHLHGVSVSQDRRYRIPFYYTVAKDQAEKGYKHPMFPPLIAEYTSSPSGGEDSHHLRITDGNGRSVAARTAGATHMLSYVQMKPEHVPDFLRMIHETSNDPELSVRKVAGAPELPSEFHVHQIPNLIEHVQKSQLIDRFESLMKRLI